MLRTIGKTWHGSHGGKKPGHGGQCRPVVYKVSKILKSENHEDIQEGEGKDREDDIVKEKDHIHSARGPR